MPRQKQPGGKRVTLSFKVSEAEAARIDLAREGMDRSEWLRLAALSAALRHRPPAGHADTPAPPAEACEHPNLRVIKGVCPDCREWAVKP